MRIIQSVRRSYLVTLGAWLAAFLVTLGAGAGADRTAFALWLGAILVGAFFEGRKAGVVATGLAALCLLGQYWLSPGAGPRPGAADFLLSLTLLTGAGVLAAYLTGECRGAVRTAAHCHDTLARLPDAVLLANGQGRLVYVNGPAEALTGRPGRDAVGQPLEKVAALTDDASRRPVVEPADGVARLTDRSGAEHVVEYRLATLPASGADAPSRLLVLRDVSERRAREQDLQRQQDDLQKLRRRLADQEQVATALRQSQRDLEGRSAEQIATLEKARQDLQEQLEAERATLAALRGDHARRHDAWNKTEEGLQQRLAELTGAQDLLRQQMAEHQAAAEALRREHACHREAAKKVEETQQQRLAELARAHEFLQGQLAERRGVEDALRQEQAANLAAWKRLEENLRGQTDSLTDANRNLQHQLAERQARTEELQRQLTGQADAHHHAEDAWRRELDDLAADRQQLRHQLDEREAVEESLRRELATLVTTKTQVEQDAAALRQREIELSRVLERADTDRLRAAEETRRLRADQDAREAALQEQAALLHADLRAAEDLLERLTDRLRPLLDGACAAAAAVRAEAHADPNLDVPVGELGRRLRRGRRLLDAVRLARQIRRGELPVCKQPVEAHAVIDSALEGCGPFIPDGRQQVTVALPLSPEWLVGDPDLLGQALAALVEPCGLTEPWGNIRLTVERRANTILFRTEDDGRDTPAEDLALARGLVEATGGRFRAFSRTPQRGTVVDFHLPACPPPGATEAGGTVLKFLPFRPELRGTAAVCG